MKLFVWRGERVCKEYGTGLVVVLATSASEAWQKLKAEHPRAFWNLQIGANLCETDEEAREEQVEYKTASGYPIEPEVFGANAAPVLVKWGGA